MSLKIVLI